MSKASQRSRTKKKTNPVSKTSRPPMNRVFAHIRRFIIRGTLALIPIALPAFALYLLYGFIDKRLVGLVDKILGFTFPGMGIFLLLLSLYLIGLIASNLFGRRVIDGLEQLIDRIPVVGTVHRVGKQLSGTLSTVDNEMFRKPVLVPYAAQGTWQIGFVTGSVISESTGETLLKVFVPTPPNPATGLVYFIRETVVRDPGWTVEEALRSIMSGGLIGPEAIK
jgi:uncharacterized membrane protein